MPSLSDTIQLSPVASDELPLVSEMAARIWPEAYRDIITPEQIQHMLTSMYSSEAMIKDIAEGISYDWILCEDEPVGFLAAGPVRYGVECYLHKCYVMPEAQGSGSGKAALQLLFARLREAGTPLLKLRVNRKNSRAIGFYQSFGFSIEAEDVLEIGEGYVMDDYIMAKYLS
jgi:ribosomal protein S18 acetylase RimI-like enzyme